MKSIIILMTAMLIGLFSACASQAAPTSPSGDNPGSGAPPAAAVLGNNQNFSLSTASGVDIRRRAWDIDIDYDTRDSSAVFAYYDRLLSEQGFSRSAFERDGDEFEARYQRSGVRIALEVERDGSGITVELDVSETAPVSSAPTTLTSVADVNLPPYSAPVIKAEWEITTLYVTRDMAALFDHYDSMLASLGWERFRFEQDDDIDAYYRKDGVVLKLELDRSGDSVEVDIELNRLRFYQ
jgi:hypothetical protein